MATATKARAKRIDEGAVVAKWPFRYEVLPLDKLAVDQDYQRPLTTFVTKIEKNYDPALVQTFIVSQRDDVPVWYAVIDGQTRMTAMRKVGEQFAPCVVYEGLSQAQEAALFAKFQTERRGMTSASRFRAQVISKDITAGVIDAVVKDTGYFIDHRENVEGTNIRAIAAIEYVFWDCNSSKRVRSDMANANPELLDRTLKVIKAAWPPPHPTAVSAVVIRGLGLFLRRGGDEVDDEKLVAKLKRVQPSELARRADKLKEGRGMQGNSPVYFADAVQSEYGRRGRARTA